MIERQARRGSIDATPIAVDTARRHEVLRPLVPDVIFRRLQVAPIGSHFQPLGIDRHRPAADAGGPCFGQQLLNGLLGSLVLALAEVMLTNASPRIDEIEGRPILVIEGAPDRVVVVDRDGILDPHLLHRTTDVVEVAFECKLGCVHADQDEPFPYFCAQARTYGSVRSQLMQV